jgi:hypothetical protein
VRIGLALILAVALLAGCGNVPPPDEATSRQLVTATVLDWHRLQAAGDGGRACRLLTDEQQDALVKRDREFATIAGTEPPESCVDAVSRYARYSDGFRELMRNTQVDAIQIAGDRATATVHTSAVVKGAVQATPPAEIPVRWVDGRWLID